MYSSILYISWCLDIRNIPLRKLYKGSLARLRMKNYVESGDAYLTKSTIFKSRDDNNYRYIQNVQVCIGSELTVSKKEITAVPLCANHSENGIKYTVQAPGNTYVYLSCLKTMQWT